MLRLKTSNAVHKFQPPPNQTRYAEGSTPNAGAGALSQAHSPVCRRRHQTRHCSGLLI
jgi:hypothetical protein